MWSLSILHLMAKFHRHLHQKGKVFKTKMFGQRTNCKTLWNPNHPPFHPCSLFCPVFFSVDGHMEELRIFISRTQIAWWRLLLPLLIAHYLQVSQLGQFFFYLLFWQKRFVVRWLACISFKCVEHCVLVDSFVWTEWLIWNHTKLRKVVPEARPV